MYKVHNMSVSVSGGGGGMSHQKKIISRSFLNNGTLIVNTVSTVSGRGDQVVWRAYTEVIHYVFDQIPVPTVNILTHLISRYQLPLRHQKWCVVFIVLFYLLEKQRIGCGEFSQ